MPTILVWRLLQARLPGQGFLRETTKNNNYYCYDYHHYHYYHHHCIYLYIYLLYYVLVTSLLLLSLLSSLIFIGYIISGIMYWLQHYVTIIYLSLSLLSSLHHYYY